VIRRAWRSIGNLLGSGTFALCLFVFIGVWSVAGTMVAQGASSTEDVVAWAARHAVLEPLVRALGLHQAFSSPLFIAACVLLALSTAVCSWRRTKAAAARSRILRSAAAADAQTIAENHDLEIACDPGFGSSDALTAASEALARLGIRNERRDGVIVAVSSPVSAWGSSVFHWALLGLIVAALLGSLQRSEGSIAIPVGATKPDAPASYMTVTAGPLHRWSRTPRSIRVDAFDPDLKLGGIDRGAVPTVSVLDSAGKVLVTQRVYPNMKLHSGSLSINAPSCGLAVDLALLDQQGNVVGHSIQLVDFSETTSGGTIPQASLVRRDSAGNVAMRLSVSVPLDRAAKGYGEWIPRQPKAHLLVTSPDGTVLFDQTVRTGEGVVIPGSGAVRFVGIGWYSRLVLTDDPTIPYIYAAMIIAMIGLAMAAIVRQQLVVATVVDGPAGPMLVARVRLWRNTPTSREEVAEALAETLSRDSEGDVS
jgi:cytochrome c biogenesis protein ResB